MTVSLRPYHKGLTLEAPRTETVRQQEKALRILAEADGSWYDDPSKTLKKEGWKFYRSGSEAKVYVKDGESDVIKTINASQYDFDPGFLLERIALHNTLSPEFPLTLQGFGTDGGNFVAIVKQPRIDETEKLRSMMEKGA